MEPDVRHQEGEESPGEAGGEVPLPSLTPFKRSDVRHQQGDVNPGQDGEINTALYSRPCQGKGRVKVTHVKESRLDNGIPTQQMSSSEHNGISTI